MNLEELVNTCLINTRSLGQRLTSLLGRVTALETSIGTTIVKALSGDIVLDVSPATVSRDETSVAWSRTVTVTFKTATGEIHTWLTAVIPGVVSVDDTSVAGTASISSADLTVVNGVATVTVNGDSADWLDSETDTLTIDPVNLLAYVVLGGTSVQTFIGIV